MIVVFNARPLTDNKKSLRDYGVKDGELVLVIRGDVLLQRAAEHLQQQQQRRQQNQETPMEINQIDFSSIRLPSGTAQPVSDNSSAVGHGTNSQGSGQDDPAVIRDMLLANPEQLALLRAQQP
ncbi:protein DDI1 homolog 2-like isoform X2 [Macrobrachium nipponense]|uniref:protein DDI1 homolog 2-like isoform X2 n=1 Tax=Macrobrachium nipponense TaxID=159736 RepID=UPI0030C7FA53